MMQIVSVSLLSSCALRKTLLLLTLGEEGELSRGEGERPGKFLTLEIMLFILSLYLKYTPFSLEIVDTAVSSLTEQDTDFLLLVWKMKTYWGNTYLQEATQNPPDHYSQLMNVSGLARETRAMKNWQHLWSWLHQSQQRTQPCPGLQLHAATPELSKRLLPGKTQELTAWPTELNSKTPI